MAMSKKDIKALCEFNPEERPLGKGDPLRQILDELRAIREIITPKPKKKKFKKQFKGQVDHRGRPTGDF